MLYPKGYYMTFLSKIKDMIRHHNFNLSDMLGLIPYEYQAMMLMIASEIKEENK